MMGAMTKLLEQAIEKIRELPAKDQDALANALLSIAGEETAVVHLDDETRAAIEEGLAQAERGEFVPDEIVAEADKRHGI
jgi:predicted transcriptional regulator